MIPAKANGNAPVYAEWQSKQVISPVHALTKSPPPELKIKFRSYFLLFSEITPNDITIHSNLLHVGHLQIVDLYSSLYMRCTKYFVHCSLECTTKHLTV